MGVFTFSSPINTSTISAAEGVSAAHCGPWMALFHQCEQGFLLQPKSRVCRGGQPWTPAPPSARDPGGSLRAEDVPAWSVWHVCCHACQERGFPLCCFLGHAAQRQRFSLCATLGQTPFSPCMVSTTDVECQDFSLACMWLLRSTSSSEICGFVVFVYFLFSCIQYLSVGLTFKQKVCLKIVFISAEAV